MAAEDEFERIANAAWSMVPPIYNDARLKEVCRSIHKTADRVMVIRALMISIMAESNPDKITPRQFESLSDCPGWLPFAKKGLTVQSIRNFINEVGKKVQSEEILAGYLYGLMVLSDGEHPCFSHAVPTSLLRYCAPLTAFKTAFGVEPPARKAFDTDQIVRTGRDFYKIMERGGEGVSQATLVGLLDKAVFKGMRPVTNDTDLEDVEFQRNFTAIRLGATGKHYVASKFTVSLVESIDAGNSKETFLYTRTRMARADEPSRIRSHGYIIPRRPDTYFAQYHLKGHGLNVSAIHPDDFDDEDRQFFRGLILAVDRSKHSTGALASRIAFLKTNFPADFIGEYSESDLKDQLIKDGIPLGLDDLLEYLHFIGNVAIRSINITDPNHNSAFAKELVNRRELTTWKQLRAYVVREDVGNAIEKLSGANDELSGYLVRPLRGS